MYVYIELCVHKYIWVKISMINVTYYHAILKLNKHLYQRNVKKQLQSSDRHGILRQYYALLNNFN